MVDHATAVTQKYDFDGDNRPDTATFTVNFDGREIKNIELSVKTADGHVYQSGNFPKSWGVTYTDGDYKGQAQPRGVCFKADRVMDQVFDGVKEDVVVVPELSWLGNVSLSHSISFDETTTAAKSLAADYGLYRDGHYIIGDVHSLWSGTALSYGHDDGVTLHLFNQQ